MEQSLCNLRTFLPLRVYATLETYAAEAVITDFITLAGDVFKLGVLIIWNGQEYRNPCKAGLAMTQSLRAHFQLPDTKSNTFDGWHRLRVILHNGVALRLDELLTPDIRRGTTPFLQLPPLAEHQDGTFLDDIADSMILRSDSTAVALPPRVYKRRCTGTATGNATAASSAPPSREFMILEPYLTLLSDFCGTTNVPDIARMVKTIPVDTVCDILDLNARRMLAALHE
jgi:hypothetical protein